MVHIRFLGEFRCFFEVDDSLGFKVGFVTDEVLEGYLRQVLLTKLIQILFNHVKTISVSNVVQEHTSHRLPKPLDTVSWVIKLAKLKYYH